MLNGLLNKDRGYSFFFFFKDMEKNLSKLSFILSVAIMTAFLFKLTRKKPHTFLSHLSVAILSCLTNPTVLAGEPRSAYGVVESS